MTFLKKLVVTVLTISVTVISSIVGGLDYMDSRTEAKVSSAKKEIKSEIVSAHKIGLEKINTLDTKFIAEINGMKNQLNSMDQKLNILIGLSKKERYSLIMEPPQCEKGKTL